MKKLVQYELPKGGAVYVESSEHEWEENGGETTGTLTRGGGDAKRTVKQAQEGFECLVERVQPIIEPIASRLQSLSETADVELSFGLNATSNGNFIIVAAGIEANLSVKLCWKRDS